MIDLDKLREPFDPALVSWRVGHKNQEGTKGMALAYIDARDVMDRLDAVCGPVNWQCTYPHVGGKDGGKTVCSIGIQFSGKAGEGGSWWVWKANGAGDTDVEADKGALSDAFKRAAVCWGIGRYLYAMDTPWVDLVKRGKSHVIADYELERLADILANTAPPTADAVTEFVNGWIAEITAIATADELDNWETYWRDEIQKLRKHTAQYDRFVTVLQRRYMALHVGSNLTELPTEESATR